jgi:thiazole/oxazole-forming peptide maturase SagD family component
MTNSDQASSISHHLASYQRSLAAAVAAGTLFEFGHAPLDRLDLPLWSVALICADGALCDGFGYGPTLEVAQTSAWGEAVEWYYARQWLRNAPRVRASYTALRSQGVDAVDPVALCLQAGSNYHDDKLIHWVSARRYPSGSTVLVPVEAVAPRYADIAPQPPADELLQVPITNGLGAGPSLEHALAHALLELVQRDGNCVNYRALDRGVVVALDAVRDPATRALLRYLDEAGIEVMVKLAADDWGMANLYVVGVDRDFERVPQAINLSACGEAAHPDRERALAKALREFVSARARKPFCHGPLAPVEAAAPPGYLDSFRAESLRSEDGRALREMRGWLRLDARAFYELLRDPIFAQRERVPFSSLPTVAPEAVTDPAALLRVVAERLAAGGHDVIYADLAPPESGVRVVRAIVPGLEVETMTYYRIGARNVRRLMQRGSPIAGVGARPADALPVVLRPESEAALGGPAWFDPAAVERAMGGLYPLYREPGRHVIGLLDRKI